MCDFSLQASKSRPAKVADKLVSHDFGRGTIGFRSVDDQCVGVEATAVCVLPGTELAFDKPVRQRWAFDQQIKASTTAIFRQINKDKVATHHDVLEMPDGAQVTLTPIAEGQAATVLQLPATPKNDAEREEQRRAEYVG